MINSKSLSMGLVADIQPADLELRRLILQQRLAQMPEAQVGEDVVEFLARTISRNVRELEGGLNKLLAYAQLTGKPVTRTLAEEQLKDILSACRRRITIDEIQRAVCEYYRIDRSEMACGGQVVALGVRVEDVGAVDANLEVEVAPGRQPGRSRGIEQPRKIVSGAVYRLVAVVHARRHAGATVLVEGVAGQGDDRIGKQVDLAPFPQSHRQRRLWLRKNPRARTSRAPVDNSL